MPILPLSYRLGNVLGSGGYGIVYQAIEANSGRTAAIKKSRVSQKVKRTILRYESTVLQFLQGHSAIPAIYGYGQLPHFEYLAMELLGPSVKECATGRVPVKTVVSVIEQMLSALEHVHKHGFVHRDIKPENLLCSLADPSKIMLIDFGISRRIHIKPGRPRKYDPSKGSLRFVGTLYWSSLNAHDGIDLAPRDDLESLAYIAFFLLHGDLPWRSFSSHREPIVTRMKHIRAAKAAVSGDELCADFPPEFGYLLDYSRTLEYGRMPDYQLLKIWFTREHTREPLEWSFAEISEESTSFKVAHFENDEDGMGSDKDNDKDSGEESNTDSEENFSNSYYSLDIGLWQIQGARDRSLTLPIEFEQARSGIPEIVEVAK
ncbi:kinase-like domain-containing protein [Crucibulum laeve]|uniref:non-specific serine/threonine protein kinase n=1 Tax=Crucibulum laeve TaxID=68775 RepID=A0A5C3M9A7_9AGAR|nr:kinase-like domain-containing protein [Crucibulum laeve]